MRSSLKRIAVILLVSGVVAVVMNSVHPRRIPWVQDWSRQVEAKAKKQKIKVIPLSVALEKFQRVDEATFVDARSADEFARGHVSGAVSIPFPSLEERFLLIGNLIDSGKELVIYCQNRECDDSLMLAIALQAMGASNLVLYVDGFDLWEQNGGSTDSASVDSEIAIPSDGSVP